ncbi:heat shock protein Hsp20 [hydrothermal vent metagenome]|uniref:Heat shock protein Hsp20 n=1 Tax=hydrothermal vent metagenome TaxID=652676 RepID=A0A1W1D080_9ZZZZ
MFKKAVITSLLALLPIVSLQADSNLTKSDPFGSVLQDDPFFKDFQKLQSDMDKVFENFRKDAFSHMPKMNIPTDLKSGFSSITLKTDVVDKGDHYEVVADLPNVDKSNIDVSAKDGILTIKAESKKKNEEKKGDKIIRQERFIGSFYRSMTLPKDSNEGAVKTKFKDGVLIVTIPKK